MKNIKNIVSGFLYRHGSHIFVATILSRLFSFFASWIALQLITENKLGLVIFAYSFIVFLIPIGGFGLEQAYIRYAALPKNSQSKEALFLYTFKKGIKIAFVFASLLAFIAALSPYFTEEAKLYFVILSFSLVSHYIFGMLKSYFRVQYKNKSFAYLEITNASILVLLVSLLSYYFKEIGYSFALILAPLFASLIFLPKEVLFRKTNTHKPELVNSRFWRYGFSASMANVATQLLFALDLILIGVLLSDPEMVTHYKYVSLIPFSLLFLPQVLITTDFVKITEQINDKAQTNTYIKNYWTLFSVISSITIAIAFIFSSEILSLFRQDYSQYTLTFRILIIGVVGIFLLRGLFGNLLSSIGKAHINFWIALASLVINFASNYYFIPKYGIRGAAITSASIMWLSGVSSYILFSIYYRKKE